jgi:hypothetical protein
VAGLWWIAGPLTERFFRWAELEAAGEVAGDASGTEPVETVREG